MTSFTLKLRTSATALSPYTQLKEQYRRAMNGNEEAFQDLDLVDINVSSPKTHLDIATLQREYTAAETTAAAATRCSMFVLENECIKMMAYIFAIAQVRKFKIMKVADGPDVAEIMLSLLEEEESRVVLEPLAKPHGSPK